MSDSLRPQGLQHTWLLCRSLSPEVCSNSCPLTWWCHPTISSSVNPLLWPLIFPSIRILSSQLALHIRWPKYWSFSFSISPSSEYSGVMSFRIDWFDLHAVWGILKIKSSPAPQFESISSSVLSLLLWSNSHIHTWLLKKTIALTVLVD